MLVTHQLQYLKDVKHIVLMNGGVAEAQGSYRSLEAANTYPMLATLVHEVEVQQQQEKEQLPQVEDFLDKEDSGAAPVAVGADGEVSVEGIGMGNFQDWNGGLVLIAVSPFLWVVKHGYAERDTYLVKSLVDRA